MSMRRLIFYAVLALSAAGSTRAHAVQCLQFTKKTAPSSSMDKSTKIVKTYLMANLVYPQTYVGFSYAIVGMALSGEYSYIDISKSLFEASDQNLELMYTSMVNAHKAHGVATDVPFAKVIQLTKDVQAISDFIVMSTVRTLFPDFEHKGETEAEIIQEHLELLADPKDPKAKRVRAYGDFILASLRDPDALAYAKKYREGFKEDASSRLDPEVSSDQLNDFLINHIKNGLEKTFPETAELVGPMADGQSRPLSEAIGGLFQIWMP